MPVQKWSDHIWVARLADDPPFSDDLDELHEKALTNDFMPHIVLDLSNVEHLNSSNLSQLLRLRKRMADREAKLRLAGPSDLIWALFLATGLDKVFEFNEDTSTALADLQIDK